MKEIDFKILQNEITGLLDNTNECILATSWNNRVTARTIYYVCNGLDIYFLTSRAYTKCKQIAKNSNIALCKGNMQIEGIAEIKGHPLLEENKMIVDILNKKNSEYIKKYSHYKNTELIVIRPKLITLCKRAGRRLYYEYLDIDKNTAYTKG